MSEMVTVRTRKLWTCLPGKPRWIVGWRQTSAETRKLFLADQSSHPSSAFRFVPGILGHWHSWDQVFPWPLERNRGSCWESCTLLSFWQLQSQRHWHWWRRSAGDRRYPKCRLRWRPKWRCVRSSTAAMSNHRFTYLFIQFINQQRHRSTSKEHTGRKANTGLTNHLCAVTWNPRNKLQLPK